MILYFRAGPAWARMGRPNHINCCAVDTDHPSKFTHYPNWPKKTNAFHETFTHGSFKWSVENGWWVHWFDEDLAMDVGL